MTTVVFSDLTHTGVGLPANNTPLAVGYVAAYARQQLGGAILPRLFKYPATLSSFLHRDAPAIACFTNYMWNERLSCAFARAIKQRHPRTVIVMGGPNYPIAPAEQAAYLAARPEIDFYVDGEGEVPFVELFQALDATGFDAARLRRSGTRIRGVHYTVGGTFVRTEPAARILDLDRALPSPYTSGLLDEFFDERLTPMLQTSRGCPYSCTFCHDGVDYMNKTRPFSAARVQEEIAYVAARARTPTLQLADLNWGLFPGDLQTAELLAETRRRTGWPRNVMTATAKNQKERLVQMSKVLGDALQIGASVQSTDPDVLRNIKRTNISLDAIVRMARGASDSHTGSFTEIILGLPGDTREKHIRSVFDMLDAGIQDARLFQFMLLPGTEGADGESRTRFRYETGFRVLARCFGRYDMLGADTPVAEIHEICLGNDTMSRDDYFACRAFDLTMAIFNNGGVVKEFLRAAEALGVRRSTVLDRIHRQNGPSAGPLQDLYAEFQESERRNFFDTREALDAFLEQPGTIDRYLQGEFGVNHIFHARAAALLGRFETIAAITRDAVRATLAERGLLDPLLERYFDELYAVSIARKSELTDLGRVTEMTLHFDFPALHAVDYLVDPRDAFRPEGIHAVIRHSDAQQTDLRKYFAQYGTGLEGIGQFLQRNDSHLSMFLYRTVDYVAPARGIDLAAVRAAAIAATTPLEDPAPEAPSPSPASVLRVIQA